MSIQITTRTAEGSTSLSNLHFLIHASHFVVNLPSRVHLGDDGQLEGQCSRQSRRYSNAGGFGGGFGGALLLFEEWKGQPFRSTNTGIERRELLFRKYRRPRPWPGVRVTSNCAVSPTPPALLARVAVSTVQGRIYSGNRDRFHWPYRLALVPNLKFRAKTIKVLNWQKRK